MPTGRYRVFDGEGTAVGTEDFRCAPGPMGWRYFSEVQTSDPEPHHATIDIAVDAGWRIARVRIDTGAHDILLEPRGDTLAGYRDREEIEIPYGPDLHLDCFTPATNIISINRLTETQAIDVVYLAPLTLEPSRVHQRYERRDDERIDTPVGEFDASRWTFTDIGSGWNADLWTARDLVVNYDTLFRLETYEAGASGPKPIG